MLYIDTLHAGYAGGTVLHGITLEVGRGTVHAVVGPNGAGKTTLIHVVTGLIRPTSGRIVLDGRDVTNLPTHRRARSGIAVVPQGRRVFPTLTVAEHLAIASRRRDRGAAGPGWDRSRVLQLLPQLAARSRHRGAQLSGGEQQMLAIARALLCQPRLVLLDEPTEGLAPAVVRQIRDLIGTLADAGLTILLTSPETDLTEVADRVTTLTAGRATTPPDGDLRPDRTKLRAVLAPGMAPAAPPTGSLAVAGEPHPPAWATLLPGP